MTNNWIQPTLPLAGFEGATLHRGTSKRKREAPFVKLRIADDGTAEFSAIQYNAEEETPWGEFDLDVEHFEPKPFDPNRWWTEREEFRRKERLGYYRGQKMPSPVSSTTRMAPQAWLDTGVAQTDTRPILTCINRLGDTAYAANGYVLLIEHDVESFAEGLNPTKISKKKSVVMEGVYPDVVSTAKFVISGTQNFDFTVNTLDLQKALNLALVYARDFAGSLKLTLSKGPVAGSGMLKVWGKSAERGDCETEIPVELHLKTNTFTDISLNGFFLIMILNGMREHQAVRISGKGHESPAWIRTLDQKREAILMPLSK